MKRLCLSTHLQLDIKPDNVLVNYGDNGIRLIDVELGDCGSLILSTPNMPKMEIHWSTNLTKPRSAASNTLGHCNIYMVIWGNGESQELVTEKQYAILRAAVLTVPRL
jgi:hypothetical protein